MKPVTRIRSVLDSGQMRIRLNLRSLGKPGISRVTIYHFVILTDQKRHNLSTVFFGIDTKSTSC